VAFLTTRCACVQGSGCRIRSQPCHWQKPDETEEKTTAPKRSYATENRKDAETSRRYYVAIKNRFSALQHATDHEEQWRIFSQAVTESAETTLGRRRGTNREKWISHGTLEVIDQRKKAKSTRDQTKDLAEWKMADDEYRQLDNEVKKLQKRQTTVDRRQGEGGTGGGTEE